MLIPDKPRDVRHLPSMQREMAHEMQQPRQHGIGEHRDPDALPPECHFFVSSKISWVRLNDDLPQYPEWPPD